MEIAVIIQQHVQRLPPTSQAEVLDFVEYLLEKAARGEARGHSEFSLTSAMRGMEDDDSPHFTAADLKEKFE